MHCHIIPTGSRCGVWPTRRRSASRRVGTPTDRWRRDGRRTAGHCREEGSRRAQCTVARNTFGLSDREEIVTFWYRSVTNGQTDRQRDGHRCSDCTSASMRLNSLLCYCTGNKKAVLSQRWPRNAIFSSSSSPSPDPNRDHIPKLNLDASRLKSTIRLAEWSPTWRYSHFVLKKAEATVTPRRKCRRPAMVTPKSYPYP